MLSGRPVWDGPPPLAVVVDLDDTLYPQADYLAGAAEAVARAAAGRGLDGPAVHAALTVELAAGSDRGGTIDRALLAAGVPAGELAALLPALVAAFTQHRPDRLAPYPGAEQALAQLAAAAPLGCLTDGTPTIQRAKLAATGLTPLLPVVVISDEIGGRAARKPHPGGLLALAARLGVPADRVVVIGDRPGKDVAAAAAVGARAVRVRQGEYAAAPDTPAAWAVTGSFPEAADLVLSLLLVTQSDDSSANGSTAHLPGWTQAQSLQFRSESAETEDNRRTSRPEHRGTPR